LTLSIQKEEFSMLHCPHCDALAAAGTQAFNVCTNCASANVAGSSFSLVPALMVVAIVAGAWFVLRRLNRSTGAIARTA